MLKFRYFTSLSNLLMAFFSIYLPITILMSVVKTLRTLMWCHNSLLYTLFQWINNWAFWHEITAFFCIILQTNIKISWNLSNWQIKKQHVDKVKLKNTIVQHKTVTKSESGFEPKTSDQQFRTMSMSYQLLPPPNEVSWHIK